MGSITLINTNDLNRFEEILASPSYKGKKFVETDKVSGFVKEKIKFYIEQRWRVTYSPKESQVIDTLEGYLLSENGFTAKNYKNVDDVSKLFQVIQSKFIEAVETRKYDYQDHIPSDGTLKTEAKRVLHYFLGAEFGFTKLSWQSFKATFLFENKQFAEYFKEHLQELLNECLKQLNSPGITENQKKFVEIFLGNLLTLFPYTIPETGDTLDIPQCVEGIWKMVKYAGEVIPLTPSWLATPLVGLGLKPLSEPQAKPLFLFYPTLYPTAPGSLLGAIANCIPRYSPGEFIYKYTGRDAIEAWVNKNPGAVFYGLSLGGSLCLQTVCDHPTKIGAVHVYGSPAPMKSELDRYEELKDKNHLPKVEVYWNHGDLVPLVGKGYHPDWKVHRFVVPIYVHGLFVHGVMSSVCHKAVMFKIDPLKDQDSLARKIINIFHFVIFGLMLPVTITFLALSALCMGANNIISLVQCKKNNRKSYERQL